MADIVGAIIEAISGILLGFIPNRGKKRILYLGIGMVIILLCIILAYTAEVLKNKSHTLKARTIYDLSASV